MRIKMTIIIVIALVAMLGIVSTAARLGAPVYGACSGNPHDRDSGTSGNPHDLEPLLPSNPENGNPHDGPGGAGHHNEPPDLCPGAK